MDITEIVHKTSDVHSLGSQLDAAVAAVKQWTHLQLSDDVLAAPVAQLNRLVAEAGSPCVADCGRLAFPWRHVAVDFDPDLRACSPECARKANEQAVTDSRWQP